MTAPIACGLWHRGADGLPLNLKWASCPGARCGTADMAFAPVPPASAPAGAAALTAMEKRTAPWSISLRKRPLTGACACASCVPGLSRPIMSSHQ